MAENAANFRANLDLKPSIFEVLATNSLHATIHPALQKVALFLATSKPDKFSWLSQYYEEVFLFLNGALQFYYLQAKEASFAECFYGLRRAPVDLNSKLTTADKTLSLIYLITLPYLKRKLEEHLEVYKIQRDEGTLENGFQGFYKKSILNLYSLFQVVYYTSTLFQSLRYISGKSEHQTIPLRLLNLKLVYPSEIDAAGFWMSLFRNQLTLSEIMPKLLPNVIRSFLEISAFFVQFLRVWNMEQSDRDLTALPVTDPPKLDSKATDYRGKCPICLQTWKLPTCLPVSGYVFCFTCIYKHLVANGFCPVTHLPVKNVDSIMRLYE